GYSVIPLSQSNKFYTFLFCKKGKNLEEDKFPTGSLETNSAKQVNDDSTIPIILKQHFFKNIVTLLSVEILSPTDC
ncbi:hypothetical protein, partial [Virgibacillus pantothenticus]|uniref:hypothetical protein n=1 Tax=Virgibacillus pantothenticus TaxID=1473 RepID=UPI0025B1FACF